METLFNEKVTKTTQKYLNEIESELDLLYTKENNVLFQNDEIDMLNVELISEEITNFAYEFMRRSNKKSF